MAVYITKKMLSKMNHMQYPYTSSGEAETNTGGDHWQKLLMDTSKNTVHLAKDMICRVCGRSGCTPLSDHIDGLNIMGVIRSITNVTIELDDSLPKYICTNCLESLRFALNFKKTCEASDKKFRRILNPTGCPNPSYPYSKHDFQLILHQIKERRVKFEEKRAREQMKREKLEEKRSAKVKQFTCSHCDLTFPNKENLVAHRRERQCMRRACDICGQLVISIAHHMRHIHKKNLPNKAHKCPTCGKEFPIIARLKNHMLVHTDTFNFFCDLCPYKCKHKYYLVMHMRTHTGEKPYKCQLCPATFVNPSNLNKHKLTHQAKQFKCSMCEKAFRTTTALREHHEATHMNIKHTCNFCGRDFCYKSDLRKHEIRSHNRMKREYIGAEPTYKQVERIQKGQDNEMDKWRVQEITVSQALPEERIQEMSISQALPVVRATYIDQPKEYIANHNAIYFTDVSGILQQTPTQMVEQQTVQLTLPELAMKKDDVKLYEPYF